MSQSTQLPLCHKLVGKIRGRFFVPRYQRGYRWATEDVQRLLDDIWACEGKPYSLQPIVVKLHKQSADENDHEWELIDGQQRLTTLYLIFRYIQQQGWKKNGAPYSISYQTRTDSEVYLKTLNPEESDKNIDYFYLYQAYECIDKWFQSKGDAYIQEEVAGTFHGYLFKCIRIIWYEAPDHPEDNEKDSAALFARLNIGRIPLTDAELVKALLLSKCSRTEEVAAQWDGIERDLRDPDIWAFVAGSKETEDYQTRIGLLLDALAPLPSGHQQGRKRPSYHTFETLRGEIENVPDDFWKRVLGLHDLVLGWFSEPRFHNKIGFLVATGTGFDELWRLAHTEDLKKSEFEHELTKLIGNRISISESGLLDLSYDNKNDYPKLLALLLLMNVETVSHTGQRFPFRRHVGKTWSLEHIHAQNAEGLNKKEQWEAWLKEHRKALLVLSEQNPLIEKIDSALGANTDNFGSLFKSLAPSVRDALTAKDTAPENGLHAISNLALLCRDDNSRLNNAVFEVKRQRILEIDRNLDGRGDGYIPVCTRNVFLKYYAEDDAQQIHFWSLQDRKSYFEAIVSALKPYLMSKEIEK